MAKLALGFKILAIWLYNGMASLAASQAAEAAMAGEALDGWHIFVLVLFFLFMVFLPEILFIVAPGFRSFIIQGFQDGDGVTHMKDLKQVAILYVSLWSMRVFMGFSLAIIFGKEMNYFVYLTPLIGSFGTAGLAVLSNFIGKRSG